MYLIALAAIVVPAGLAFAGWGFAGLRSDDPLTLDYVLLGVGAGFGVLGFVLVVIETSRRRSELALRTESADGQEEETVSSEDQPRVNIESHNQSGGFTGIQLNVQPGDRRLSDNTAKQIKDYLDTHDHESVEVIAVAGDTEAFRFASQIKDFLVSVGMKVQGVNQALYSPPPQPQVIEHPKNSKHIKIIIGGR